MTEHIEANFEVQDSHSGISAGMMLRQAREAAGLSVYALAITLKVPVKKLEALESDQFDLLPDTVFIRALAACVCRALKIDSVAILELLPQTAPINLKTDKSGINAPFRTSGSRVDIVVWNLLSKPFVLMILILLIGVCAMVFFPLVQQLSIADFFKSDSSIAISSSANSLVVSTNEVISVTENAAVSAPVRAVSTSSLTSALIDKSVSASYSASAPVSETNLLPAISADSGAMAGLVVFTARGPSWVEVLDSLGAVQLRKTMVTGEVATASGIPPLTVVVGRADTTDVQVRGKPIDLVRIAKDNVARFEVK
jgi:cytoskeleton protein RodZ